MGFFPGSLLFREVRESGGRRVVHSGAVEGRRLRPRRSGCPGRGLALSEQRGLLGGDDVVEGVLADALRDALQPLVALLAARRGHSAGEEIEGVNNTFRSSFISMQALS